MPWLPQAGGTLWLYTMVWFVLIAGDLSHAELMMMTIADIIKQLIEAHEQGNDVNLNK